MIPKMTASMALEINKIEGSSEIELFTSYYKAFTKAINLFIKEKMDVPMMPVLEMFTRASDYFESCLLEDSWDSNLTKDYIDGMKWFFEESCPQGFVFDGERFSAYG